MKSSDELLVGNNEGIDIFNNPKPDGEIINMGLVAKDKMARIEIKNRKYRIYLAPKVLKQIKDQVKNSKTVFTIPDPCIEIRKI